MKNKMIDWQALSKREQQSALARPAISESGLLSQQVENILNNVKRNGDKALYELTEKFDGVKLTSLVVTDEQVAAARKALSAKRLKAIETAYGQIKRFHQAQICEDITVETTPGVRCTLKTEAIESVGLYIPAGSAPLPSTVLMLGVLIQGNEVVTKKAFLQKESSFSKTTLKKEKKGIKIPQQSFTTFFKEENKIKVLAT